MSSAGLQSPPWARGGTPRLVDGNRVRLLESGAQFFPALLAAIDASRRQVHVETYLYADDAIGHRVGDALVAAALRGVQVRLVVDGFGGGDYARRLVDQLHARGGPGLEARIYRPQRWWRLDRRLLRRLHRKIAVIDGSIAFVGGINIIDDCNHAGAVEADLGPRFDFAVACEGPVVASIALAVQRLWWAIAVADLQPRRVDRPRPGRERRQPPLPDGVRAALLLRDNLRHRRTIERAYLDALQGARQDVLIASAYFLPGSNFRAALLAAAGRGVRVRLLLQGRIEYLLPHRAQQALYGQLLAAGIEIHVYRRGYLHAKAAVIDDDWATVGSSNIDPYSLLLAREANLCVRDPGFAGQLRAALERAMGGAAQVLAVEDYRRRGWFQQLVDRLALAVVRVAVMLLADTRGY